MSLKISLILSLVLHTIILFIEIDNKQIKQPKKKPTPTPIQIQIKTKAKSSKITKSEPKSSPEEELFIVDELNKMFSEMDRINKESDFVRKLSQPSSYIAKDCKKFYIGIGIVHGTFFNRLSEVVPNGPADKAGLRVGDELFISNMKIRDVYPIGTLIHITFVRDGIMITVPMKVAKICTR